MAKAADDKDNNNVVSAVLDPDSFGFPSEFPYELGISSPVESMAGSTTETESSDEEEDFFAALTRRLSQSSLHDSRNHHPPLTQPIIATNKPESASLKRTRVLSGSPQSTLSGIGSWSGRSVFSGEGSPNGSSRVPSPTTTPFGDKNDPWEVIYAAAGQVARLKYINETQSFGFQNKTPLGLPHASLFNNQTSQVREEHVLKQQCGSVWGRQAKPNRLVQQQVRYEGLPEFGYEGVKCTRPSSLPQSAWTPQPQNQRVQYSGSGSRHGLPGGSGVKRGCGGTGVFLPRHNGYNPTESRKKSGRSTASVGVTETSGFPQVLVPAKVVHALNYMNMNDLHATSQPRISNAFATDYDALLARRNALLMQQRLSLRREEAANYETRLPQEWTY